VSFAFNIFALRMKSVERINLSRAQAGGVTLALVRVWIGDQENPRTEGAGDHRVAPDLNRFSL
jgi:hypothetical protein